MVSCPICKQPFGSQIELSLHISHEHRGQLVPIKAKVDAEKLIEGYKVNAQEDLEIANETMLYEEPKADEEAPYSLAASREGLGELSPVLKDINGDIIDGFHRLGENANWHTITVPTIDTPVKLELARLAVNFNRRKVSPEELSQRITFLIKSGLKPEEIAKQTGIKLRTVQFYTPQEFKNPVKVAARLGIKEKSDATLHHTVEIPDSASDVPKVRTFEEAVKEVSEKTVKVAESSFASMNEEPEPEIEESISPGTPCCPVCKCAMDPAEYKEIKQSVAKEFGKSIQTLLFPEVGGA